MGQLLPIVAQYTMDQFYQEFRQESQFFILEDFIYNCGATLGDYYRQEWKTQYDTIRAEKSDEIVTFSPDVLNEMDLDVKDGTAAVTENIMSFAFDRQNSGIQDILVTKPDCCVILERSNIAQIWQLRYVPTTNRIFWYTTARQIKFYNPGMYNVQKVKVLFVPAIGPTMTVPDSLVDWTITNTVQKMKQIKQGSIVKSSIDLNQNPIPETEVNKLSAK
jgi:hypothetical protein